MVGNGQRGRGGESEDTKLAREERRAALTTMAAAIAHEVNNPLSYTIINLQVARKRLTKLASSVRDARSEAPSTELAREMDDLREMLDLAHEGTVQMRAIIDDLRAFSRDEDVAVDPVDLGAVIDAAAEIASAEIQERAKLVRRYGEAPLVRASAPRLMQVFLNLLMNAAHAIPEGDVEANEIGVLLGTTPTGDALVEVRDTGRGIGAELMFRIFDPFFTTKALDEGTGLGLFISRIIVTSYGGEISAEAAPERGTVFRVRLPPASRL